AADLLPSSYADAVAVAGGLPMLLPPAALDDVPEAAAAAVRGLDGLVLAGGADVARPGTGPSATSTRVRRGPTATAGNSRWWPPRWNATCRCWRSAAGCRCSTSRSVATWYSTCPTRSGTAGTAR